MLRRSMRVDLAAARRLNESIGKMRTGDGNRLRGARLPTARRVCIMALRERPLSPHLQIYRPQITSVLSILHRITGAALAVGTLLLVYWLVAIAGGPDTYDAAQSLMGSIVGRLLLLGWTWALFYHLANGVRHLFWDAGKGFELPTVAASGWAAVILATALTLASWIAGYAARVDIS